MQVAGNKCHLCFPVNTTAEVWREAALHLSTGQSVSDGSVATDTNSTSPSDQV